MTKEDCLKELAQPELPRERAAYLLGYLKALDPQHLPPRELWDRVLGGNDERINAKRETPQRGGVSPTERGRKEKDPTYTFKRR